MTSLTDMRSLADFIEANGDATTAGVLRGAADTIEAQGKDLAILRAIFADIVRSQFTEYDAAHNARVH